MTKTQAPSGTPRSTVRAAGRSRNVTGLGYLISGTGTPGCSRRHLCLPRGVWQGGRAVSWAWRGRRGRPSCLGAHPLGTLPTLHPDSGAQALGFRGSPG